MNLRFSHHKLILWYHPPGEKFRFKLAVLYLILMYYQFKDEQSWTISAFCFETTTKPGKIESLAVCVIKSGTSVSIHTLRACLPSSLQ